MRAGQGCTHAAVVALVLVMGSVWGGQEGGEARARMQDTDETTVAWVCETYPERVTALFEALDLDRDGLDSVRSAVVAGDLVAAGTELLAYYREGVTGSWLRRPTLPAASVLRDGRGDAVLQDTFTFYGQTDRVPRTADGGLVWTHAGPAADAEWALALNRHHHLGHLLSAYLETGNREYVVCLDQHIRDWVTASLPYPGTKNASVVWRGLEISSRAKAWARVFYALQRSVDFTPAARLLMLTSLPDHAHHLRHFHGGGNWLTMELSGLAMIATAWPEYRESNAWFSYASSTMERELAAQVYPDGVQHELTSHYHLVALSNFEQLAEICRAAEAPLSPDYREGLERMWNYLACTMRPDGHGLLNNDSDRVQTRDPVLQAAATYGRPDWLYMATHGESGAEPASGPSFVFPFAGQLVVRSGRQPDALWGFFDFGPWGTGHQHNDKLHLSVSAHGRDLLVDSGRFTYSGREARFQREYAVRSQAHNVVLIDGHGQGPGPALSREPVSDGEFSTGPGLTFARGACDHFSGLDGSASHTRVVLYPGGSLLLVVDRIETDRPRSLEALWHWHPTCTVTPQGGDIVSVDPGAGNLRIVPVGPVDWHVGLVRGQEEPEIQGWYSREYNGWEPTTTSVLHGRVSGSTAFAWLLACAPGEVGPVRGAVLENTDHAIRVRVERPGVEAVVVRVPWQGERPRLETVSAPEE